MNAPAKASSSKNPYRASPPGELKPYSWITKADTKFNAQGLYHGSLILEGEDAQAFKQVIDDAVDAAFLDKTQHLPPAKAKKYGKQYPYAMEEDETTGEETGRLVVTFKQNAKIIPKDKTKEPQDIKIRIEDSNGKEVPGKLFIGGGSLVRFKYAARPVVIESALKVGVRLDFSAVQILKLVKTSGGGSGSRFDKVEGGWTADAYEHNDESDADTSSNDAPSDGDY